MWFFSRKTRRNAQVRSVRRTAQLRLETLEDRCVPASLTFTVTNTSDSDVGSLRWAVLAANNNAGADIIQFAAGVTGIITLTSGQLAITDAVDLQGPGDDVVTVSGNNASRVFYVSANVTISGLTISGGSSGYGSGIFNSGTMTVDSTTLSGNSAAVVGGGIYNEGTLTVRNSILSGNSVGAGSYGGGGIYNTGTMTVDSTTLSGNTASYGGGIFNATGSLTVLNSIFSGNSAFYVGGAIDNQGGTLTVHNSTLSGNSASHAGGAVHNRHGMLTVHNSTLSDNSAGSEGGGIFNWETLTVDGSTLSGNSANYGGGIFNLGGGLTVHNSTLRGNSANHVGGGILNSGIMTVDSSTLSSNSAGGSGCGIATNGVSNAGIPPGTSTLNNTIVAGNFSSSHIPRDDIDGTVVSSSSHNLIGVDTNLSGINNGSNGNLVGTAAAPINPMLGSLQNNGGPTQTMALLPGSPAIDAGDNSLIPPGVTTDQRGTGYARIDNGTVDIGAYEFVANQPPVADAGGLYIVVRGGTVQLDASATFDQNEPNTGLTYEWDFDGDGDYDDATGIAPIFSAAGLVTPGPLEVGLRVTDAGGLQSTATATVEVLVVGLIADPCEAGKTALAIGGTLSADHIIFNPGGAAGSVQVILNGVSQGSFTPTGRLIAYGQAGNDDIQVAGSISLSAWLDGGTGDDRLKGGAGNDVLLGGDGADLIVGGQGRDILIGGTGADRLVGNADDDILIAGITAYDGNQHALCSILHDWVRTDLDYGERIALLQDPSQRDGVFLGEATVDDDDSEDILTGSAGQDWFWANYEGTGVLDKVTDLSASEFANDLDFINAP